MESVITFEYLLKLKAMKIKKEKLPDNWQYDVDRYILGKLGVLAMWRKELENAVGYEKEAWQSRYKDVKETLDDAEEIWNFLIK